MNYRIQSETAEMTFSNGRITLRNPLREAIFTADIREDNLTAVCENDRILISGNLNGVPMTCEFLAAAKGICVFLRSEAEFQDTVCFPPNINVEKGMTQLLPYCEGIAFDVSDEAIVLPPKPSFSGARENSMSFWGYLDRENPDEWILCAVITNADAEMCLERGEDGLLRTAVGWIPEKGKWGYTRELRYVMGNGGIGGLCRAYREIAEERELVRTLREKKETVPNIDKLVGSANIWVWNDDAMDKLYSANAVLKVPTEEQLVLRRQTASDMKKSGLERVMWSIFDENVDKDTVAAIKNLGYLTTFYDIYTDVIPGDIADKIPATRRNRCKQRMQCWPKGIVIDKNGNRMKAWALKGMDGNFYSQNYVCDKESLSCAAGYVPKHTKENGLEGRFLDVVVMSSHECYSDEHPMNRRDALAYKRKLLHSMGEMGLVCGTEVGREDIVPGCDYNEGMMSPPLYRAYDAGRRMTNLYYGDEIDKKLTDYMLNPRYRVPLWELVYHDCMVSYWYWGDSTNCCPELMPLRDLFDALYALPPIYSFKISDWEQLKDDIIASYNRTVPVARELGYERMTDFAYLDDTKMIQMTTFGNGTRIVANFGKEKFAFEGTEILPGEKLIVR